MPALTRTLVLIALLVPVDGWASFAPMSLETAVAQADLVVVATLEKPTAAPRPTGRVVIDYRAGLKVHRTLAGDLPGHRDRRCVLEWTLVKQMSAHVDHKPAVGKKGIWLLRRKKNGRYAADHPSCFRPLADLAAVEAAVKGPLYLADVGRGKACCITLEIRTFQPRLEVRDFVSIKGGKIRLHGQALLEVQGQMGKPLRPLPGCLVRETRARSVVVRRGRPHRVKVDLRRCFSLRRSFREAFHLEWGRSREHRSPSYTFEL
jgi:hypothetical protein